MVLSLAAEGEAEPRQTREPGAFVVTITTAATTVRSVANVVAVARVEAAARVEVERWGGHAEEALRAVGEGVGAVALQLVKAGIVKRRDDLGRDGGAGVGLRVGALHLDAPLLLRARLELAAEREILKG